MTKKEELLIDGCKLLKVSKEVTMIVMACLRTDKQQGMMLDWLKKHHQENPSEDKILEVAEAIKEQVN